VSLNRDLNTIYKFNSGKFIGMKVNTGTQFENFINISFNNKPKQAISPNFHYSDWSGFKKPN
jgi:hypothetical protein